MTRLSDRRRPLAVLLPEVGLPSETFVRRDVNELLPGGTVAVVDPPPNGASRYMQPAWSADPPVLGFEPVPDDPPPTPEQVARLREFLTRHHVQVALVEYLDLGDRWFDHLVQAGVAVWLRGHGVDISARLRDPDLRQRYARYRTAAGIIVPSRTAAERLRDLGLPADRVHVLPCGVDVPADPPQRQPDRTVHCLSVGRLVPKKAPLSTLEAFRQAHTVDQRLRLDLIGDGPLVSHVRAFLDQHSLASAVRLHGTLPHPEVLARMRQADLLLHHAVTSPDDGDAEGLPVVVLEAMAAGLPVIATRHEGIPEAVYHGRTGLLVDEGDVDAMGEALLRLAASPEERTAMGRRGWRAATERYSYPRQRTRLLNMLGLGHG
jgi:colanic acid/amylovoran biosynthesis glycosyltransferase